MVITNALDGMIYAQLFHGRDDRAHDGLQDVLLALTRSQEPLVPPAAAPR